MTTGLYTKLPYTVYTLHNTIKTYRWKECSSLSSGINVGVPQHPAVMHTSRPSHVDVCEPVAMIDVNKCIYGLLFIYLFIGTVTVHTN